MIISQLSIRRQSVREISLYFLPQQKTGPPYREMTGMTGLRFYYTALFVQANGFSEGYSIPFGWLKLISSSSTPMYLNTSYRAFP